MFIKFDDAFASFQLWLRANPKAAAKLPSKSFADTHDGRAFVQKYAKEWTNEMLFAYLLVAGCAEGRRSTVMTLLPAPPRHSRLG